MCRKVTDNGEVVVEAFRFRGVTIPQIPNIPRQPFFLRSSKNGKERLAGDVWNVGNLQNNGTGESVERPPGYKAEPEPGRGVAAAWGAMR